jgi:hypothetical protein
MNDECISMVITELMKAGYLVSVNDQASRIHDEMHNVRRLKQKGDFLSIYNLVIRYMFIRLLQNGHDIHPDKVHPALKIFLKIILSMETNDISVIIKTRNGLKYQGIRPSMAANMLLMTASAMLSNRINSSITK